MKRFTTILSTVITLVVCTSMASAAGPLSIPVSITGASATPNPALRPATDETISATITAVFTADSGPTLTAGGCHGTTKTNTTTTVAYTDKTLSATANAVSLSGTNGGTWSGSLSLGVDGKTTVAISASASETETTTVVTETLTYPSNQCGGTPTSSSSTAVTTATITGGASANTSFVTDLAAPTLTIQPDTAQPFVQQGADKNVHNLLLDGSEGTAYNLTDTVTNGTNTYTANGTGTFGPSSPAGTGIAPTEHDLVAVHIACDAPIGQYTASAVANTVDLGGNAFPQISSVDVAGPPAGSAVDTFTVTQGVFLEDQTAVVSELPPSADYAPMTCFTAGTSGRKVSTFPGSLHITAVVNTTGPCAGFATISGAVVTLTLPVGFSFDTTGASPAAHVFVVDATNGFDFHYPGPEIALPKSAITGAATQTLTVDLTGVNFGQGVGVIPATDTIYVRAHAVFTGSTVPADGTQYLFATSTSANLTGIGPATNSSTQTVTKSQACVDGN